MKTSFQKQLIGFACLLMAVFGLYSCKLFGPKEVTPQVQGIVVTVKDKFTKKPIPNATVKWSKSELSGSGSTDKDGIYRKDGMADGKYLVIGTANDYKLERAGKDMTVEVGAMTSETFELTPETLEVTPRNVTFSDGEKAQTVYFKNKNSESSITLSIEVPQKDDWVKVSNSTLTIPAGSQKDITVTVDSKGRGFGSYNSTVTLNFTINGRPDNDELNIYLSIANPSAPSISTDIPTFTQTSADVRCTVTNIGGSTVTDRGIYVSESSDPKASNSQKVSMGPGGIGSFVATAKGLKSGGRYFARGYALNSFGEGLGEVREFVTSVEPTPPTLAMNPVLDKDVSLTTAVVSAKITSDGGSAIKEQGFVLNTTGNPTVNDTKISTNADANGNLTQNLTNLTQNTTYHIRAYAINSLNKIGYSEPTISFKTKVPVVATEITTLAATDVRDNSAKVQGEVVTLGSSPIIQHGFCWSSTNILPEIEDKINTISKGTLVERGVFNQTLTGLTKGSVYYYRAFAVTQDGKVYYGNYKELVTTESGIDVYYPFNENTIDESGKGNNSTTKAKFVEDRHGNMKQALDLNSGHVTITNSKIGGYCGDYSVSFWIKTNSSNFNGTPKVLLSRYYSCLDGSDGDGFAISSDPDSKRLVFFIKLANNATFDSFPMMSEAEIAGFWRKITITKSGTNLKFYLNGRLYKGYNSSYSCAFSGGILTLGARLEALTRIGGLYNCNTNQTNFNGLIDEFRIYNYPMTDAQVEELFKR